MALNYHLVKRPDMRKDAAEGSELYYAQVRALKKISFEKLCNMIAMRSTAFIGDVMLVIEGLLSVMQERLEEGDIICMGRLGNFCMVAGSKGVSVKKDFDPSLFNDARIVYVSGTMLADIKKNAKFEELKPIKDPDAGSSEGGSGEDDRPVIE